MIEAYILGKIAPTKEKNIEEILKKNPNIKESELCFGRYDFIALCEAENIQEMENNVIEKIRAMEEIQSTETLIIQDLAKLEN